MSSAEILTRIVSTFDHGTILAHSHPNLVSRVFVKVCYARLLTLKHIYTLTVNTVIVLILEYKTSNKSGTCVG